MIREEAVMVAVMKLSVLAYFPSEQPARVMLADLLMRMCHREEELDWLVRRAVDLWSKWEGPRELRAIYCARFKPKDGIDINYSNLFADGIVPPETPLPAPAPIALPAGHMVTADKEMEFALLTAAEQIPPHPRELLPAQQKAAHAFEKRLEEVLTEPSDREPQILPKAPKLSEVVRLYNDKSHEPKPAGTYREITAADIEREVAQKADRSEEMITRARATLADSGASKDQIEMAREILRGFGVEEAS